MADTPLFDSAVEVAPNDYEIPAGADRGLKSVAASFDGSGSTASYQPAVQILSPSGAVVVTAVCPTIVAAGASADVSWFPLAGEPEVTTQSQAGVTLDSFFYDTKASSAQSTVVLVAGESYTVTVQGTYSAWNEVLDVGTPNADAMFPSSTVGRVSTEVGVDAETIFAWPHDHPHTVGHDADWQFNLGSGFQHIEPIGGPFSTPQPNYLYRYTLVGQGNVLIVRTNDSHPDDYGKLQVTIQGYSGGSSGGGGGGALLPPTTTDYAILQSLGSIPLWSTALDGGSA